MTDDLADFINSRINGGLGSAMAAARQVFETPLHRVHRESKPAPQRQKAQRRKAAARSRRINRRRGRK